MAKTSIYLPDDLAEQVRSYSIPVSEVAQDALRQAVKNAQIKENAMTDVRAVAERLRGEQRQADAKDQAANQRAHDLGAEWARTTASADALRYLAEWHPDQGLFKSRATMVFGAAPDGTLYPLPGKLHWEDFRAGAREVWEAVQPLLSQCGDDSSLSGGRPCALDAGHAGPHKDDADDPQHVW